MSTKTPVATPEMLNAIRADASPEYQRIVPLATRANLQDVGNPITSGDYQAVTNEFLNALLNKIVMQIVEHDMWSNPLARLRRGDMPLGTDIEDIHTNPAQAEQYTADETGMADLLKEHKPDVASVYYRLNRKDKYPVTIYNDALRGAFTGWPKLEALIAAIVDSLYNANSIDEFMYTKQLISGAYAANKIVTMTSVNPVDDATGKQFMKQLRTLSTMFTFPSTAYNSYKLIGGEGNDRITWSPIDRQVILVRGDVASAVGVDVLSTLFNVNYADYVAPQIIVDSFDAEGKVLAVLCDERAFMIMTQLRQFATFFNPSVLGWQYYYHAWDLFAMNPFQNAVALVQP